MFLKRPCVSLSQLSLSHTELVVANMVRRVLHLVREIAANEGSVVTAASNDDAADVQALGYADTFRIDLNIGMT